VIIANGVVGVSPEMVKVTVKATNKTERTISNVPVSMTGIRANYEADFLNPANGQTNITVSGPSDIVSSLSADDFKLTVDASGLEEGEHEVAIKVTAPRNVNWKLANEKAKITVAKKEA